MKKEFVKRQTLLEASKQFYSKKVNGDPHAKQ